MPPNLKNILEQFANGNLDQAQALRAIEQQMAEPLGFATIDHDRPRRCGAGEVIYAAGKSPEQVVTIARTLRQHHPAVLVTRADPAHQDAIAQAFVGDTIETGERSGCVLIGQPPEPQAKLAPVTILTAGTSDLPVAEEARLTVKAMGQPYLMIHDVGVAGLHRLGGHLATIRLAKVIIVIAGMEGALPSVVGGLVDVPIIAVPTSVGYGTSFGGITALLGMLNACASGVVVVNIDNGFGAAYAACRINRQSSGDDANHA